MADILPHSEQNRGVSLHGVCSLPLSLFSHDQRCGNVEARQKHTWGEAGRERRQEGGRASYKGHISESEMV